MPSRWLLWSLFATLTLSSSGYFGYRLTRGDQRFVVPGTMSRGHYPIESECQLCHTPMLGVKADACMSCHADELERVDDSHPPSKFTDPRNADRLTKLDARSCVVCHVEHRPEITLAMGVTQPIDYCNHCHEDIATERPSHAGMAFNTCQDAGCHNFHDNRSLHEDYLAAHLDDPELLPDGGLPAETRSLVQLAKNDKPPGAVDAPAHVSVDATLLDEYASTAHAEASVSCRDCHSGKSGGESWIAKPDHEACARCHEQEHAGFVGSKHGMRLHAELSPMTPSLARLPMRPDSQEATLSCTSCHGAHRFDRAKAAVQACLACHADSHSLAYQESKHYALFERELLGEGPPGSGVSCASCHLPRVAPIKGATARVQHNQNDFLRPNEKLIDAVCARCHGVPFAIDALADPEVIARGVEGRPRKHVKSVDLVRKKLVALAAERP